MRIRDWSSDVCSSGLGVHSRVRACLGLACDGYDHKRLWSIADAELTDWPYEEGTANVFLQAGGEVGFIIPIGPGRFRAISNTPDAPARIPGDSARQSVV